MKRKLFKILFITLGVIVFLFVSVYILIRIPAVQTWLTHKIADKLSEDLNTKVEVRGVDIDFFKTAVLEGIYIEDQQGDTLIYANELKLDIGLFKLFGNKIHLREIQLNGAIVNFYRGANEENFNYQFLADYLKGDTTIKDTTKGSWQVSFKFLKVNNAEFRYLDQKTHLDLVIHAEKLRSTFYLSDLDHQHFIASKVLLDGAYVSIHQLNRSLDSLEVVPGIGEIDTIYPHLNTKEFQLLVNQLDLKNIRLSIDDDRKEKSLIGIDMFHLDLTDLNLSISDGAFIKDTIFADIRNLSFNEKSGFSLNQMKTLVKLTPKYADCRELFLKTDYSVIRNAVKMKFDSFHAFYDFVNEVTLDADLEGSLIDSRDVAFFAPLDYLLELNPRQIRLSGTLKGTVSNLRGKNIELATGEYTRFKGNINLRGLPDFNETFIDMEVSELITTENDLRDIYPQISEIKNLNKLGIVFFTGRFTGFKNDFVAKGTLSTSIGSLTTDINMKLDENGGAKYSGNLSSNQFDIGQWFSKAWLGKVSFDSRIDGEGLVLDKIHTGIIADVNYLELNDYVYHDIDVNGSLDKKLFSGFASCEDSNLIFNFIGTVDFNQIIPFYDFKTKIKHANLFALNFSKEPLILSANIDLEMSIQNLDTMDGSVTITDFTLRDELNVYDFNELTLSSEESAGNRTVKLRSDLVDADIEGKFRFSEIYPAFSNFLKTYFDASRAKQMDTVSTQSFTFSIKIKDSENFTGFISSSIGRIKNAVISGSFESSKQKFTVDAAFDKITFADFTVEQLTVNASTESKSFFLKTNMNNVYYQDSLMTKSTKLDLNFRQDSVMFSIDVEGDSMVNDLNLKTLIVSKNDSVRVHVIKANILLNREQWVFNPANLLSIHDGHVITKYFDMTSGDKKIELIGAMIKTADTQEYTNNVSLDFNHFVLRDILQAVNIDGLDFDGEINGSVTLNDFGKKAFFTSNLIISEFTYKDKVLGDLTANAVYNSKFGRVVISSNLISKLNDIDISGYYNVSGEKNLNIDINIRKLSLNSLSMFTEGLVSDLDGMATGKLNLSGVATRPDLTGKVFLVYGSARVNYLNTKIYLQESDITFTKRFIDLSNVTIVDDEGNMGYGAGVIRHRHLDHFFLDFHLKANKFLALNTTELDNSQFYGKVYADIDSLSIRGPIDNIEIYSAARTLKGTSFFIPLTDSKDIGKHEFFRFVNMQDTVQHHDRVKSKLVTVNFDIVVTPDAEITIIVEPETGERLTARGNANLKVSANTNSDFEMAGTFEVNEGKYYFNYQGIINKDFTIEKGGTISWTGDAYDADLNLSAVYTGTTTAYYLIEELIGDNEQEKAAAKKSTRYKLYMILTGQLMQPEINFDIELPEVDPLIKNKVESKLALLRENQNELNKQVFGLMVSSQFLPSYGSSTAAVNVNPFSNAGNSLTEFLSTQISLYLTDWISKNITMVELRFQYSTGQVQGNDPEQIELRRQINVEVEKAFMKEKIVVSVGGTFGFGNEETAPGTSQNANNYAGDVVIEYLLTEDGRVRIKAFSGTEYDVLSRGNKTKTGVGLFYREEFDTFKEFFDSISGKNKVKKKKLR